MNVQEFGPDEIIDTSIGLRRVRDMEKRLSSWDNYHERGCAREFWYEGSMVRRDVSIQMKKAPEVSGESGGFAQRLRRLFRRVSS